MFALVVSVNELIYFTSPVILFKTNLLRERKKRIKVQKVLLITLLRFIKLLKVNFEKNHEHNSLASIKYSKATFINPSFKSIDYKHVLYFLLVMSSDLS